MKRIGDFVNKIKFIFASISITLIFLVVAFITYNLAEPKAYDFMTKQFSVEKLPFDNIKKTYGSDDIILVVTDIQTVQKYRWPWKRDLNCKIIGFFSEYTKAKLIISDTILTSLDSSSLESDKKFFNKLKTLDNYISGFMPNMLPWEDSRSGEKYERYFSNKYSINLEDLSKQNAYVPYWSMLKSPYSYLDSIKNIGHVYLPKGGLNNNISPWAFDNVTRTNEYVLKYSNAYYPSLALKAYLLLNKDAKIVLKDKEILLKDNQKVKLLNKSFLFNGLKKVELQTYSNPIYFYKIYPETGYSHIKYSTLDVIESYDALKQGRKPTLNPRDFDGKIIILGANVPAGAGLNDNKNSSIKVNHPGIDLQATVIDNIINNDFVFVLPQWVNVILTIFGMLFVYGFIRVFALSKSVTSTIATVLGVSILGYLLLSITCFYFRIIINVLTPLVMFVLTTILAYVHNFINENRSKEKVKSAMGKYMSQDVMKRIVQNIDNLGLGGKKSVVTVLFADIRGFTSMSEQMSAQEVSEILNEYFTEMEPIITRYNGVINKFIGDAVMAIFGEPIQDKNHAQNAVKCAYSMLLRVKELQKKWVKEGKPKIEIGVGVNTGEVFVGNIGSINRMEYTVIGDTVNLASRLESYNKIYKTKLLISPSTYEEVKGFTDVIKISDVQIRGKANKMDIYEVLKVNIF